MVDIVLGENIFLEASTKDAPKIAKMMIGHGNCRGFFDKEKIHVFDSYGFTHTSFSSRLKINTSGMHSIILWDVGLIYLADQFGTEKFKLDDLAEAPVARVIRKIYDAAKVPRDAIYFTEAI
ncbi:hypothetical protein P9VFCI_109 [Rhizobium phage P9VFCI]|uniref:Uncharacterized protein n=1 Tax=Rhizobium phage P9VFCI TaxID=2763531 RepID=A0A7G7WXG8_9CAUD|nr:hypothetical protein PP937_gp109 [Rhizobium phage P9VFCI]QNH71912.1 hypothetical protein P9VFCI_109 [Rhizobium phage P9VFCI]